MNAPLKERNPREQEHMAPTHLSLHLPSIIMKPKKLVAWSSSEVQEHTDGDVATTKATMRS